MHAFPYRTALGRVATLGAALLLAGACGKKGNETATTQQTSPGAIAPAAGAVQVADVTLGRGVGPDKQINDKADEFKPNETIYASVHTTGTAPNATVATRWTYEDGQLVSERSESIAPSGDTYTEFHVLKPSGWPEGKYTVHVLVNGQEVQTKDFKVEK